MSAIAVNHDFVPPHVIAFGKQVGNPAQTSHHVEELVALLAEEEVVMMPGGALIMRLSACKLDMPRLSFLDKLPESAVNRRNSQSLHLSSGLLADGLRRQGLSRRVDYFPDGISLAGFVSHKKRCLNEF
jgi:hypothetical protein